MNDRRLTTADILSAVARVTGVPYEDIIRPGSRMPDEVHARRVVAYLCRERTVCSFPEIARAMNRKGHSTAIDQHRWVREHIETDAGLRALVARCAAVAEKGAK